MFEHVDVLFFPEITHLLDGFAKRFHVQVVVPFEKIPHGLHVFLPHPLAVRIVFLGDVLVISKNNKTSGSDGFTIEFYRSFWDVIGQIMVDCFNYAFENGIDHPYL